MYSGWVGDEDDTFQGLEGTLKRYLQVRDITGTYRD